jgi:hypothetical protein
MINVNCTPSLYCQTKRIISTEKPEPIIQNDHPDRYRDQDPEKPKIQIQIQLKKPESRSRRKTEIQVIQKPESIPIAIGSHLKNLIESKA